MIFFTKTDVLKIHRRAIAEHGGKAKASEMKIFKNRLCRRRKIVNFMKKLTSQRAPRLKPIIFPKRTPLLTATKESQPFVPKYFY